MKHFNLGGKKRQYSIVQCEKELERQTQQSQTRLYIPLQTKYFNNQRRKTEISSKTPITTSSCLTIEGNQK